MKRRFGQLITLIVVTGIIVGLFATAAFAGGAGGSQPIEGVAYKLATLRSTGMDLGRTYLRNFGSRYGWEGSSTDPAGVTYWYRTIWYSNREYRTAQQYGGDRTTVLVAFDAKAPKVPVVRFYYLDADAQYAWPAYCVISARPGTNIWAPDPWALPY